MSTPIIQGAGSPFSATTSATSRTDVSMRQRIDSVIAQAEADTGAVQRPEMTDLVKPVLKINEVVKAYGVQFDLSETGGRVVARVVDVDSGDVIRQIPNETVLRISERLDELVGVLIQDKA